MIFFGFFGAFAGLGGLGLGILGFAAAFVGLGLIVLGVVTLAVVSLRVEVLIVRVEVLPLTTEPLIVDRIVLAVATAAVSVLGFGETLVIVLVTVLALPAIDMTRSCVSTLETGDCEYTSVTSEVNEVAFPATEVACSIDVTVVTGPPSS